MKVIDIDAQEQYEHGDSVVVHYVRERGPGESLHHLAVLLCAATGGTISPLEVSVAHRLGQASNRPRPIIIKFTRRCVKTLLMHNKKKLRHTAGWHNVYVDEDLTIWRRNLVSELNKVDDLQKVMTIDGKIMFTLDKKRYEFNTGEELMKLFDSGLLPNDFWKAVGINHELIK